jgi:hypothetical protein
VGRYKVGFLSAAAAVLFPLVMEGRGHAYMVFSFWFGRGLFPALCFGFGFGDGLWFAVD